MTWKTARALHYRIKMSSWLGISTLLFICLVTCYQDHAYGRNQKEKAATYKASWNQVGTSFDGSVKDDDKNKVITYHVPAQNKLDQVQINLDFEKSGFLYNKFLTPRKLLEEASYNSSGFKVTDKELLFNATSLRRLLLRIPLVEPGVLSPQAPLTVKIVVAQNTDIANSEDSDIAYGISDGQKVVGMYLNDKIGYSNHPPCTGFEGTSGLTLTNSKDYNGGKKAKDAEYPGQFELTLKPSQHWGSCYIAHKSGTTWQQIYKNQLSLDRGLNLEVYSHGAHEKYGIKYVAISVISDF